jgi:foldase protein PrsA
LNRKNLLVVLVLALGVGAACAALAWHRNRPVARVDSQSISAVELSRELHERFGAEVLQDLVNQRLVARAAEEAGMTAGEAEIDAWVADFRKRPEARVLLDSGRLPEERLRRNLATVVPLYNLALQDVSEEDRKQYFRLHRSEFEELQLRHIRLGTRAEATELRQRIHSPADFLTLASVHSQDQGTRASGGDLGRVTRAELEDSFAKADVDALFSLAPNGLSEPLHSDSGSWHLFLMEGRTVHYEGLRRRVLEVMARPRLEACLEGLRAKARIEILLPSAQAISPQASPSTEVQK